MTTEENPKLALWNRLFQTPTDRTKPFKRGGGFSGTAISPYYCVERATEEFGPHGKGWGHEEVEHLTFAHKDGQTVWMSKIKVWYELDGVRHETGPQWGQTMLVSQRRDGSTFVDEEAPKKAITDGLTKCLSYLGIGGDVHAGLYDDNKYVSDLRMEERKEREREEAEERRAKAAEKKGPGRPKKEDAKTNGADDLEAEAPAEEPEVFDPASWRDRVCAEVKLLKTEKAIRNFWATQAKKTVDHLMADEDEERRKIALYVHSKIRDRLHEVKEPKGDEP